MTVLIAGGDSFTYGSELPSQEHTWANLLANRKGWNICNIAQPGYSNSAIRRNVMNAVNEYKDLDLYVAVMWSFPNRYEFKFPIIMSGVKFIFNDCVKSCFSDSIHSTFESIEFCLVAFTDSSSISRLRQYFAPYLIDAIPKIPEPHPKSITLKPLVIYFFIKFMHIFVVG